MEVKAMFTKESILYMLALCSWLWCTVPFLILVSWLFHNHSFKDWLTRYAILLGV